MVKNPYFRSAAGYPDDLVLIQLQRCPVRIPEYRFQAQEQAAKLIALLALIPFTIIFLVLYSRYWWSYGSSTAKGAGGRCADRARPFGNRYLMYCTVFCGDAHVYWLFTTLTALLLGFAASEQPGGLA